MEERKKKEIKRVRRQKIQVREMSKSRLAKAARAEPCGKMRNEKLNAAVAQSMFPSQNVQNASASDHIWKFRCRKIARHCGEKHISKSRCTKHTVLGALLEVGMWKNGTPLWHEAHFEVKMFKKNEGFRPLRCPNMCTPWWREAYFQVKMFKT